jgi:hypothetical protein
MGRLLSIKSDSVQRSATQNVAHSTQSYGLLTENEGDGIIFDVFFFGL